MNVPRTNLQNRLQQRQAKTIKEKQVINEVKAILKHHKVATNKFNFDALETNRIYHINTIKHICTTYRLRFLDLKYFKPELPEEAHSEIRMLEKKHQTKLDGFKVMAPSKLFKLEDKDDPLLFVPLGNDYYYLIHKWGNDLHPLRKILVWPFKSIGNLLLVLLAISLLATILLPQGLFSKTSSASQFWIIYFFVFKSLASVALFYGFALGKNFNPFIWNSKYFNA
ncbi:hypothetical protein [Croceivirga sp. JEA036]|uniref:hypothetical protein n=1 Tax=Croceivirga sp. JEA036 TaxID=2721162 RepID=UPI00143B5AE4|nr:hypothetical protein [Croceivirga sp. JEA036]NJB35829.1 hypothetical protein [Croceivirga sp. JEA036]